MASTINYVSTEEFDAIVAAMEARKQSARAKRFTGKKERNFKVQILMATPYTERGAIETAIVTIRGYTLADAKEQAGIR